MYHAHTQLPLDHQLLAPQTGFSQIVLRQEDVTRTLWCEMRPAPLSCFTPRLLQESRQLQRRLRLAAQAEAGCPVDYLVLCSGTPGVFSLGGDLGLFLESIRSGDRERLRAYARACVDVCHQQSIDLDLPLRTIALVQGDALGGGFEAALSCSMIIAERQAEFGFPETLFNMFPGMGALSFLARRIGLQAAERLIAEGRIFSAEEMHAMGVVDVLAEPGGGAEAVYTHIAGRRRARNGLLGLQRARRRVQPVDYGELLDIAEIWTETAFGLEARDLRMMERLLKAQRKRAAAAAPVTRPEPAGTVAAAVL